MVFPCLRIYLPVVSREQGKVSPRQSLYNIFPCSLLNLAKFKCGNRQHLAGWSNNSCLSTRRSRPLVFATGILDFRPCAILKPKPLNSPRFVCCFRLLMKILHKLLYLNRPLHYMASGNLGVYSGRVEGFGLYQVTIKDSMVVLLRNCSERALGN